MMSRGAFEGSQTEEPQLTITQRCRVQPDTYPVLAPVLHSINLLLVPSPFARD